ncbi:MAG: DUF4197 domain-containing protein [Bacteroidetes bacterium]|nr:DUF4197 domain-containing protein [Bacteroidota bacterium]HET6244925.1 DUF4197 domain-containing protein [Bacteroidia bacterium]
MKKIMLILFGITCISNGLIAQINLNNALDKSNDLIKSGQVPKLTNDEVVSGLREALTVGINKSTASASVTDGFNKNPKIKIPFPKEVIQVKTTAEKLGMKPQVDKFVLSLNRAAEEASKEAAPIFINAIKSMSVTDGFTILKGADNAATEFLNDKTSAELRAKFKPIVQQAINKVQVTKFWTPLATNYNKVPGAKKVNPNLEEYVTLKAIEGLFVLLAEEELKIRKDPSARISDLLKKVFG